VKRGEDYMSIRFRSQILCHARMKKEVWENADFQPAIDSHTLTHSWISNWLKNILSCCFCFYPWDIKRWRSLLFFLNQRIRPIIFPTNSYLPFLNNCQKVWKDLTKTCLFLRRQTKGWAFLYMYFYLNFLFLGKLQKSGNIFTILRIRWWFHLLLQQLNF